MKPTFLFTAFSIAFVLATGPRVPAAETPTTEVAAGHSFHGEAFNEGPRQTAVLMSGMASIDFPTSTESETAQKFIEQGIAQLHGFLYLEAERSFRQAAKEDPDLAIAYWGMAMANVNNDKRARGLIDEAKQRSSEGTSRREELYIEALDRYLPKASEEKDTAKGDTKNDPAEAKRREDDEKKRRGERYIADMEKILHEFPDDIEAKALLAVQLWMGDRKGVKLTSRYAVDALLSEVFAANPDHPAHHYRIHLWDSARPENALRSAAKCGPASPGIAHMWHMPGHIYSKLKRYNDAAWQQEASARVDHAHMIQTRLMPDQIHNFAHNNEWLVRNLIHVGRVADAKDLARNLVSLPRHPKYNTLSKRGSYKYGRERLVQLLTRFELWEELIEEAGGQHLPPTDDDATRQSEQSWLAVAQFMTGDSEAGQENLRELQRKRLELQGKRLDLLESGKTANSNEVKTLQKDLDALKVSIARVASAAAVARKDAAGLKKRIKQAKLDDIMQARWLGRVGEFKQAIELAERAVKSGSGEVLPLATLVDLLWQNKKTDAAKKHFESLRSVAGHADIDTPLLAALAPVAKAVGAGEDWRMPPPPAKDLGERPPLDSLGPFRWKPYQAESWTAVTPEGERISDAELPPRPRLVIFYLGFGCLHCVEQLHAFAPHVDAYRKAGIDVIGISTESQDDLVTGVKAFDKELKMPLYADGQHQAFKSFRCWDDFEDQPLHGTFLIDAKGRVRWQDISYEPFMDAEFLLEESQRLLELEP